MNGAAFISFAEKKRLGMDEVRPMTLGAVRLIAPSEQGGIELQVLHEATAGNALVTLRMDRAVAALR